MLLAHTRVHRRAIAANVAIAFLLAFMCGMVSLNGDAQQIAVSRGAMFVIALIAAVYLSACAFLQSRPLGPFGEWFIARGAIGIMLVVLVIYFIVTSLLLGRVV